MKESQFQTKVIEYLKTLPNTWHVKIWGGGFQRSGIPDILCCINGKFVALELKKEDGKSTPLQERNIKLINAAGGIGLFLRPSGFEDFKKIAMELLR